jgi:hypothetical protein
MRESRTAQSGHRRSVDCGAAVRHVVVPFLEQRRRVQHLGDRRVASPRRRVGLKEGAGEVVCLLVVRGCMNDLLPRLALEGAWRRVFSQTLRKVA